MEDGPFMDRDSPETLKERPWRVAVQTHPGFFGPAMTADLRQRQRQLGDCAALGAVAELRLALM